ncbi:hypothetical protein AB1Y20_018726 [Prymnesium parvum]
MAKVDPVARLDRAQRWGESFGKLPLDSADERPSFFSRFLRRSSTVTKPFNSSGPVHRFNVVYWSSGTHKDLVLEVGADGVALRGVPPHDAADASVERAAAASGDLLFTFSFDEIGGWSLGKNKDCFILHFAEAEKLRRLSRRSVDSNEPLSLGGMSTLIVYHDKPEEITQACHDEARRLVESRHASMAEDEAQLTITQGATLGASNLSASAAV